MKNITDHVEEEPKKTESPSLKDLFIDSLIFPLITVSTKGTLLCTLGTHQGSSDFGLFEYYIIGSMIMDMGELYYRVYIQDELRTNVKRPFSFFEKHLFYDVPKYLYNQLRK